ncbi:unannotated protein [freshwater metagenome]|uniref:Unannotated protein n=1 Tax=freshwater metagenome TaxID=449393 RepID=A0A6J6XTJ5_9ZZZZ
MNAFAKVNLSDGLCTECVGDVNQHRNVDAIAFDEGELLEHRATSAVFTGERLHNATEFGETHREKWSCNKFSDSTAAAYVTVNRSLVETFDKTDRRIGKKRSEKSRDKPSTEITHVGIAPHDNVAGRREQ